MRTFSYERLNVSHTNVCLSSCSFADICRLMQFSGKLSALPPIKKRRPEYDSKRQLFDVAVRLFAERGLDAVSVRDITSAAGVNLGAVNYHFGSKDTLIHEIYAELLGSLQSRRLARLDKVEAEAGGGRLDLESVLRALIEPTVQEGLKSEGSLNFLPRLMFQAYAVSRPFLDDRLAEENDRTALRFLDALSRSVPEVPYERICLRYYAIIGGLLQLITDAQGARRIERLSQGRCSGANPNLITEELVALYKGGFSATQ
ncbi:TetR/AcrR family transcriptional regulator (plasmid) [Agrobacterium tumefaciens]|uniref:TetR/AcrR family transcriptional regulator n=1 Tax=Agrobacterium tumefaciens TaxID=358 RepID=UPI0013B3C107|nr:TetR/AcrR family transcriptional regulator [Agrobacterium tumefaciens]WQE43270.1 TetR/AcrR family transcriptional regulator [Agrobacterium tumefaciens]